MAVFGGPTCSINRGEDGALGGSKKGSTLTPGMRMRTSIGSDTLSRMQMAMATLLHVMDTERTGPPGRFASPEGEGETESILCQTKVLVLAVGPM